YPSETLIRFGISTPVLPIVTFTFSIPHHLKPTAVRLGELSAEPQPTDRAGDWAAVFKDVPLGSFVLRLNFAAGNSASFPVEVVKYSAIEPPTHKPAESTVKV